MNHLSFYWLPDNRELLLKGIETEFFQLVEKSVSTGKISLPPISEVVLRIQKLSTMESTSIVDIADSLLEDPGLAAIVVRVANSVIFNRRNITCTDLITAVSRLGILRVRDIVTAQAVEQLKYSVNMGHECNHVLKQSAINSRELAATMVMVVRAFKDNDPQYQYLETDKAMLIGFLADIGLFCIVSEYHHYLKQGNYLDITIALQLFERLCANTSQLVLESWGFDQDFVEVATNRSLTEPENEVTYLDVARIAHHLLMFRRHDSEIDEHFVELNLAGADVLYKLTNLSDSDFQIQLDEVITASGL
ncbi:HDOD domain-containing protein [Vibrio sp.]|uniref:HDOD domain-containing protein n=1 Tax=Vibrio sp. TaxID=678 RepID=UPI003D11552B